MTSNQIFQTRQGKPACVADNDPAFGRIVKTNGESKFQSKTLILATEDDLQDGWTHASGTERRPFASAHTQRAVRSFPPSTTPRAFSGLSNRFSD